MSPEEFNHRSIISNIGSKYPIRSSQYKHSREYDYRNHNHSWSKHDSDEEDRDPLHLRVARGVFSSVLFVIPMWLALALLGWIWHKINFL
jgi:hypothetical protein